VEAPVAFLVDEPGPGLEIVVNFGILTGREATQAEIDRLARMVLPDTAPLSIVAARRHEYSSESETVVHQVVLQAGDAGPASSEKLLAACEAWAADCAADRHVEPLDL
jgi:hypothetical protein